MKRKLIISIIVFIIVLLFFTWQFIRHVKFLGNPEYHAIEITLKEETVFSTWFYWKSELFERILPDKISRRLAIPYIVMHFGLGSVETLGGRTYNYVFIYLTVKVRNIKVGLLDQGEYILNFVSNSSYLDSLFKRYGIPHIYMKAVYIRTSTRLINHTYIRFDYPEGRPFIEILVETSELFVSSTRVHDIERCLYYLNGGENLTAIYLHGRCTSSYFSPYMAGVGGAYINITVADGSEIWRYVRWKEYISWYHLNVVDLVGSYQGKIGWLEWN